MEILLKSYINIFHFPRYNNQTIGEAFNNTMTITQYIPEPQGEAIGWHPDSHGYFTISEEKHGISAQLYFYPRTVGCMDKNASNYNNYAGIDDGSCNVPSMVDGIACDECCLLSDGTWTNEHVAGMDGENPTISGSGDNWELLSAAWISTDETDNGDGTITSTLFFSQLINNAQKNAA